MSEPIDVSPNQDGGILKKIIKQGTSNEQPCLGDKVTVHYVGTLEDGTKFDSSRDRADKFEFDIGKGSVIKGWDVGVATMKKGEVAEFTIKAEYGYGEHGSPPKIPPNATLIFEIELFDWKGEDLSKDLDGGILRSKLTKGEGYASPNDGASVEVELRGLYNGQEFESRTLQFTLGEGLNVGIVDGIETALKRFKKGEKSVLKIAPNYAFGKDGYAEKNIPPNATVVYEVRLIHFEKAKESWEMDSKEKIEQSELLKTRGTSSFKEGKYKMAWKHYQKVIDLLKEASDFKNEEAETRKTMLLAVHLNLAMCALKVDNHFEAQKHCDEALELSPQNEKGLYRRGMARIGLQDYQEAISDFKEVLQIKPTNKAAKIQLAECQEKIKQHKLKEKKTYAGMFEKFAEIDAKKNKGNEIENGLNKVGDWKNDMADGMLPLEQEVEAFGEKMPEAQYNKDESEDKENKI